jgi:hypothetical protein
LSLAANVSRTLLGILTQPKTDERQSRSAFRAAIPETCDDQDDRDANVNHNSARIIRIVQTVPYENQRDE